MSVNVANRYDIYGRKCLEVCPSPKGQPCFHSKTQKQTLYFCLRWNHLWISPPVSTHKLIPDLFSLACQHSHKVETCSNSCMLFFCRCFSQRASLHGEMSDSTCGVLSVALASQCRDLTSSLSLQRLAAEILNQLLENCWVLFLFFFFFVKKKKPGSCKAADCESINSGVDLVWELRSHISGHCFRQHTCPAQFRISRAKIARSFSPFLSRKRKN